MNGGKGSDFLFENGRIIRQENGADVEDTDVSEATEARRALESYRETRARKTAIKRTFAVCIIFAVVLLLVGVFVFLFFRINDVKIEGSEKYTQEELYSALKLSKNSNLFFTSSGTLEERLREAYPSLDGVTIKKQLPDKLIITVTDGFNEYYLQMGGDIYLLTRDLKITERTKTVPVDCVELKTCDVTSAIIGEKLTFKTNTHYNYLKTLLNDVREHKTADHIKLIDMSEKFNVKLKYDDRFIIVIGDADNASLKLTLANDIIKTLQETEKGVIDASDTEKCSFRRTSDVN